MKRGRSLLFLGGAMALATATYAQVPSPALVVLNKGANELAIVDPVNLKVVGRVPTGEGPHEVAVSADGKTAFVANYGTGPAPGSTLSVIDLATRRELKRVNLGGLRRPHGIVENGGRIYFTCEGNKLIARYDPASGTLDWMMGTGQE
ncbi:MAG TPA: hypothetical protein VFA60_03020 [Terriglobales bacterium]|nr:hypothetical protein [Terriglobales bacterium]